MKLVTRTMIVMVILGLTMQGSGFAQDATEEKTCTISGRVGLPGVMMQGLPGGPIVSDENGRYTVTVQGDWTGAVRPTKEGFVFQPPQRSYAIDLTHWPKDEARPSFTNQDYVPHTVSETRRASYDGMYGERYGTSRGRSRRSTGYQPGTGPVTSRRVLVVPSGEIKAEELAEVTEDMQVMSHILDERFSQTRRVQGIFTDFGDFFGRDNRETEAIYLQGYGVLFSMEVNFTFSPQPEPQAQQVGEPNEQADPTWQQARQEVFQPGARSRSGSSESTEEQSRRMVDELKKDLIATLKHAANIRGLQPDEWVILTVIGAGRGFGAMGGMTAGGMMGGMGSYGYSAGGSAYGGGFGGAAAGSGRGGMMGGYGGGSSGSSFSGGMAMGGMGGYGGMGMGGMAGPAEMGANSATVLTIRAKKADVDAFAGGELNAEQFQSKVRTVIY